MRSEKTLHLTDSPIKILPAGTLSRLWRDFRPYRRGLALLLLPLSLLLTSLASANPQITESVYSRGVYPVLAGIFGRVFGFFPFAIAEIVLYGLVIGAASWLIAEAIGFIRKKDRKQRALHMLATICCIVGAVYFAFTMLMGFNYHRVTFAEQSGLSVRPSSVAELGSLYSELVEQANHLRGQVNENEAGAMTFYPYSVLEMAAQAPQGINRLAEHYPVFAGYTPRPKPVLASRGMSMMNVGGIYIPFTFEATFNADMPHASIPHTMLHELAHFKGFMREDEANFIAYLAAREMDSPAFRYSGAMLALIYTGNALFAADRDLFFELNDGLDAGIRRDFAYNRAYWQQFEGRVAEVATAMNDAYLRHNRQEDGVRSYGRMVDLLLADYRARHNLS